MNSIIKLTIVLFLFSFSCDSVAQKETEENKNKVNDVFENDFEGRDTSTYAMPIGSKFILDLIHIDEQTVKYEIIGFEEINYALDYSKTDSLFSKVPQPGTIECFFTKGVDQGGPFKSVLILRNNSDKVINYNALISYQGNDGFYKTSVHPLYPGARSSELWNDHLSAIVINNLKIEK